MLISLGHAAETKEQGILRTIYRAYQRTHHIFIVVCFIS